MGLISLLLSLSLSFSLCVEKLSDVDSDTLVVCDLDETLIRYPSHLGSTCWFEERYSADDPETFHQMAALLADRLEVVPCHPELPEVIAQLQSRGVTVVGLTARQPSHPVVADWPAKTAEQLAQAGYNLSRTAPEAHFEEFHYSDGILMAGDRKAEAFGELLGRCRPSHVLLVDDRQGDLERLSAVAAGLGIQVETVWVDRRRPYDRLAALGEWRDLLASDAQRHDARIAFEEADGDAGAFAQDGE